jgi:hypothetical protein
MTTTIRLVCLAVLFSTVCNSAFGITYTYTALPGSYVHLNLRSSTFRDQNLDWEQHATSIGGNFVFQVDPDAHTFVIYGKFDTLHWYPDSPFGSAPVSFQLSATNGWSPLPPGQSTESVFDPTTGTFGAPWLQGSVSIGGEFHTTILGGAFKGTDKSGIIEVMVEVNGMFWGDGHMDFMIEGPFHFDGPNSLQQCKDELGDFTADSDSDNVPDYLDRCLGSVGPADTDGCDKGQFCNRFNKSSECKKADWKNDQPLGASECTWQAKLKRCLPRN